MSSKRRWTNPYRTIPQKIKEISVHELKTLFDGDTTLSLIDVRTPEEFYLVHVPGVKALIQHQEIVSKINESKFPKGNPVYLICRSGRRSLIAARELAQCGYESPINIKGGTLAWIDAGYPVIKQ